MLITLAAASFLLGGAPSDALGDVDAALGGGPPSGLLTDDDEISDLARGWRSHLFEYDPGHVLDLRVPSGGRDDARVAGVLVDLTTGLRMPVTSGHRVIVRGPVSDDAVAGGAGVRVVRQLMPSIELVLVESARADGVAEDAAQLAERLTGLGWRVYPDVVHPKRTTAITVPPNDPRYGGQFYLEDIGIEDAWRISTGSADVTILVADNGCDITHPDLADKMDEGFDPFEFDRDPSPPADTVGNEHGTACSGIIGASTDNGVDVAGTCPECRLRCSRLLPGPGEDATTASDILTFQYALDADVDIVSNSWGFTGIVAVSGTLRDAINNVHDNGRGGLGALVTFATGNDDREIQDQELLAVRGVLGVGAVNNLGELTQFSNGGRYVDIVAPTGTLTTDIAGPDGAEDGDVMSNFGGTSSACPVASGVIGLMLAKDPDLTSTEVEERLIATARQSIFATPGPDGHDDDYGFGLIQPAAALSFVDEEPPPPPPPECTCAHTNATTGATGVPVAALAVLALLSPAFVRRRALRSCAA